MKKLNRFLKNEKGQGIMEYIILSGLIGIICLATVKTLGTSIQNKIKDMKMQINQQIKIKPNN